MISARADGASIALGSMLRSHTKCRNGDDVHCQTNSYNTIRMLPAWTFTRTPQRSSTDTQRVPRLHEWCGGTSAWSTKYSQGSSTLHPRHRRHRTQPNQQPLWRSCVSGDAAGYGSTCPSKEEQTGLHKQSRLDHWWPSWTDLTYSRYIHNYARQPSSWNAHTAVGNLSARSKRHLRPQMHTGDNYWD
jgi:hypothetical protein